MKAARSSWVLQLAQGGGLGRLHPAPGTWGSLGGVGWTLLLLLPGQAWIFAAGCLVGVGISVWACGEAERRLGARDPGSVVLDEIVALPLCFAFWVLSHPAPGRDIAAPLSLLTGSGLLVTLATFLAFRCFDIAKPWPVKQSQSLPGGWGVTMDDVLAAGYVNLLAAALTAF